MQTDCYLITAREYNRVGREIFYENSLQVATKSTQRKINFDDCDKITGTARDTVAE